MLASLLPTETLMSRMRMASANAMAEALGAMLLHGSNIVIFGQTDALAIQATGFGFVVRHKLSLTGWRKT